MERKQLYEKINNRVDEMMRRGLFTEVKNLEKHKQLNSLQTVGYKELFEHLEGKYDMARAIELIKQNTRNFAKRQLTWFRKDQEVKWFEPKELDQIKKYTADHMK